MFRSLLVAVDQYRTEAPTYDNAMVLADTLHASLRMIYVVRFRDLRVVAPGPPTGEMTKRLVRGSLKETRLIAEGHEERRAFSTLCERASIDHSSEVLVGPGAVLWAEEARSCDLTMIRPAQEDFRRFERWFGSMFWTIVRRSNRPLLLLRQNGWPTHRMVMFYSNHVESARALPWVVGLCSGFGMALTVYLGERASRTYARDEECKAFLEYHQIPASFEDRSALDVLYSEVKQPNSQLGDPSLLVFDRGFHRGPWFRKRRRLVEHVMRSSHHHLLLCP